MRFLNQAILLSLTVAGLFLHGAETFPARRKPLPVTEFYRNFKKTAIDQDIGANFGRRAYLGTAGTKEHYNTLTLGWGAFGVLWSKPAAIVYIRENRFSFRFFEENPVFVLSWYPEKYLKTLYQVFGGKSGRDTDKETLSGFTPVETPDGGVTYLEAEKVIICRKMLRQKVPGESLPAELRNHLGRDGFIHIQYTGEVLSVWRHK